MSLVAGYLEIDPSSHSLFNSAWLIDESGIIARYRKIHLFDHEKDIFTPGIDEFRPAKDRRSQDSGCRSVSTGRSPSIGDVWHGAEQTDRRSDCRPSG